MRTPSELLFAALLSGALLGTSARAGDVPTGQPTGAGGATTDAPVVQAATGSPESSEGHCSVVGAVQHPGTYRTSGGGILLQTLLDQAGGLTGESSGIVRILHDGRQQMINLAVSTGSDVVPPGSVIVADPAQSAETAAASAERTFADIACVQLLDRPVVFCLKPADATLPRLLNLLGQPSGLAASVRVVVPAGRQSAADFTLPSGTVVLFDSTTVDRPALAEVMRRSPLNDLVELELVEHQQVAAETVEQLESLEQFLKAGSAAPAMDAAFAPEVPTSPVTAPLPPASSTPSSLAQLLIAPEPGHASAPDTLDVRPVSALQLRSVSSPVVPPDEDFTAEDYLRAKQRALAAKAKHDPVDTADEVVSPVAADVSSRWLNLGTSVAAWLLCAFAAYGAFGIWMRQQGRRREVLRHTAALELPRPEPVVEARSALSQLIDNSLPLREEDTATPSQVFHGRTVGFRYLIRSGPHPLQGPHFAAARVQPAPEPVVAATTRPQAVPKAVSSDRVERTINRFDRAVETNRAPTAPRSAATAALEPALRGVSPLERALRSLMRERTEGRS